jgi:hypothetical protein
MTEVDLQGEAGWEGFDAPALVGETLRFVSGDQTGNRFRMSYFRNQDQDLVARVWFGPVTEGPPGHAHGGSIAAVLDEVLGLAAWAAGCELSSTPANSDRGSGQHATGFG